METRKDETETLLAAYMRRFAELTPEQQEAQNRPDKLLPNGSHRYTKSHQVVDLESQLQAQG